MVDAATNPTDYLYATVWNGSEYGVTDWVLQGGPDGRDDSQDTHVNVNNNTNEYYYEKGGVVWCAIYLSACHLPPTVTIEQAYTVYGRETAQSIGEYLDSLPKTRRA